MAMEARVTGSLMQPDEPVRPDLIRPGPEPNRLDARLRFSAYLLMFFGSCFITDSIYGASNAQDKVFLGYALFLFGVSLLFVSVMLARYPFAATFAAFLVQIINNFIFGDS